ncbi:hypothetical protein AC249_AIPGENE8141 [Exaiptasia diaphana]|nr:hypothetical protein AC249_AIPGENE8141 [Exaiptasia diaphana]
MGLRDFLAWSNFLTRAVYHIILQTACQHIEKEIFAFQALDSSNKEGFAINKVIRNNVNTFNEICSVSVKKGSNSVIGTTIFGTLCSYLINTGAILSSITAWLLARIPKLKKISSVPRSCVMASLCQAVSQNTEPIDQSFIPITIDEQTYPFRFPKDKGISYLVSGIDSVLSASVRFVFDPGIATE